MNTLNKLTDPALQRLRAADGWRLRQVHRVQRSWRSLDANRRRVVLAVLLVGLYLLPLWNPPIIGTKSINFPSVLFYPVGVWVLVAIGLNVVVGQAGMLDLGYVAFFAIGAYTVGIAGELHASWPWLVCVPIGVVAAMLSGVLLGAPTLRLRGDYLAIVTLGFGELVRIVVRNTEWMGAARGISNLPRPPKVGPLKFGVLDSKPYYWLVLTVIIGIIVLVRRLEHSRVGRAWTAIREDEDAAELMGVPTFKFKLLAFAIGAGIGGLSGTLYAGYNPSVQPETFKLLLSIMFLAAVVLGGSGNLPGVIVGAILVAYLPERFRSFQDKRVFIFGLALVVMMIFRPQGILPSRRRTMEIGDTDHQQDVGPPFGADLNEPFSPQDAPRHG